MKKYLIVLFIILGGNTYAQDRQWMTGIRDTSYSSNGDYRSNKKKYPFIVLIKDSSFDNVREHRGLVYSRLDGRKLRLDAFTPKKSTAHAAVVIVHGGGWRSGDRSQHIPLAQHLAKRGIAAFTIEYRLSTEALYPAAVFDVKESIRWVKANARKFGIDTNKIAVIGFSAGGQLASLVGLTAQVQKLEGHSGSGKNSSSVNAVIDIDGTLSFVHAEASETQEQSKIGASAMWLGYPRTERLDLWTEASPLTYAPQNKVPFLFLNSSVDRMHAGRDDFTKLMDQRGIYNEVVTFKDAPHSFCLYDPWFTKTLDHIVSFLTKVFIKNN